MIEQHLRRQLERVAAREQALRVWRALAAVWLLGSLVAAAVWYWQGSIGLLPSAAALGIAIAVIALALAATWREVRAPRRYQDVARRVEARFPELNACLMAAVEQQPAAPGGRLGFLQTSVVRQALEHARRHDWRDTIAASRLRAAIVLQCASLLLLGLALAGVATGFGRSVSESEVAVGPELTPATSGSWSMSVEPGNVEVELGASLTVLARIQGQMPIGATLHYQPLPVANSLPLKNADEPTSENQSDETATAEGAFQLAMTNSLADPIFSTRIPVVDRPLEYYVEIEGQMSPTYRVTVFELPRLVQADARLEYPDYTGLEPRTVPDVRTISVVEGTRVTLQCRLNKPVVAAILEPVPGDVEDGETLVLAPASDDPLRYEVNVVADRSRKVQLVLRDDAGRRNLKPETFHIHAIPNQPPSIKPLFPARDVEVSALEELHVRASAVDDFGLVRFGLTYALAGKEPVDVVLAEQVAAKERQEVVRTIELESLAAEPDQLLSYFWWAEDRDANGGVRRVQSDMYFAEVRPFEEVFRAGDPPTRTEQRQNQQNPQGSGQGQNAQQAQELAKLQKDIINATWKVMRREIGATPTAGFAMDVDQIRQSQDSAGEQAEALAERLQDERSLMHVEQVLNSMRLASEKLSEAHSKSETSPLPAALSAAQQAYQSLLKLRAREHEVVRQQQQQQSPSASASQSAARSEQQREQLQQLDLRDEENRYETQRTAQERQEESAQEREDRQVLNRLRELARRQHDLNDRIKELQTALEEAESPQEKEEVRRQLQRLQDEQRQILQDTDELQSRLDQPENQERLAEQRQRLDETRDQVRRASEALKQERVTQAAAAGSRAEQQFEELREELRRRSSQRFQEEMREMRQSARDIEQRQQELTEQLQERSQPEGGPPRLQEEVPTEQTSEELGRQRERLTRLQDQMRDTIERAEATEPLLSERLYDSARNLRDQSLDRALQTAERAARQGLRPAAEQLSREAERRIGELREGIEKAAEGVLGDETEALRRAREELRELSQELNEELQRNVGERTDTGEPRGEGQRPGEQESGKQPDGEQGTRQDAQQGTPTGETPSGQPRDGQPRDGQPRDGQPRDGQPRDGQPRDGQPRDGQPRDGQPRDGQPREGQPREGQPRRGDAGRGRATLNGNDVGPFDESTPGVLVPSGASPLTGDDFRNWSDRLRDVEEMVDDPDLRAEAARIRERARAMRAELKRHSAEPKWDLVREQLSRPLEELEDRVEEELLRRSSKKALVPLDRDPAPPQYSERMRRYYERLGSGE